MHVFATNHFYCHCCFGNCQNLELQDEYLVTISDKHPLSSDYVIKGKFCTCYKLGSFKICSYCINVRYMLNFNAQKVYMKEV